MHRKSSVQFFGLPGAGKTALLRNLVTTYPDYYESVPKLTRGKRWIFFTLFISTHPLISIRFFILVFKNPLKLWSYLIHLVSVSCADYIYAHMHASQKMFLIDEGITQRLLSVVPSVLSEHDARKLVGLLDVVPIKIIFVQGGGFERFTKESDRMGSYRNKLGEVYLNDWMSRVTHNTAVIAKILGEKYCLITIDNHEKNNLERITEELHRKISAQG